ncbi:MAG TPA: DinB family protein [Terriglobales bacterium]|nr:DinB family protein [Terriglobales bacterium]
MSNKAEAILNEFRAEMPATRRLLERVPGDKLTWKPHAKSRSLGELAAHIAGLAGMAEKVAASNEFVAGSGAAASAGNIDEIRQRFEQNARASEDALSKLTDEAASGKWRLVFQGKEILSRPRIEALRTNVLNHLYHHRGQMSVYLRLLDVAVPTVYGPTADENPFA